MYIYIYIYIYNIYIYIYIYIELQLSIDLYDHLPFRCNITNMIVYCTGTYNNNMYYKLLMKYKINIKTCITYFAYQLIDPSSRALFRYQ